MPLPRGRPPGRRRPGLGSDSRAGLTPAEKGRWHAGGAAPAGHSGKINAALRHGGPELLTRTVERATGPGVDHYLQARFKGFVRAVDALGGAHAAGPGQARGAGRRGRARAAHGRP
ncbi:LCP family protein, partial [Streptomyces synnematoformans]|uniref:LCP family glycopolymer transferase n=1 Tax=Streptomyces synnematoformans TaxID=415721 RepID=UPI0031D1951F